MIDRPIIFAAESVRAILAGAFHDGAPRSLCGYVDRARAGGPAEVQDADRVVAVSAPAGAEVGIYVDLVDEVTIGDVIETQTGRRYLVTARRAQLRGRHVGRQHLRVVVLDPEELIQVTPCSLRAHGGVGCAGHVPKVHRIRWYRR